MIRYYFDEDAQRRSLVQALRARGADVVTALDVNMIDRADVEHLAYAAEHGRVLFSFNVGDFYALHTAYLNQGSSHSGIVLARQQVYSVGELMRRLLRLTARRTEDEMVDRVEFLGTW